MKVGDPNWRAPYPLCGRGAEKREQTPKNCFPACSWITLTVLDTQTHFLSQALASFVAHQCILTSDHDVKESKDNSSLTLGLTCYLASN